MNCIVEWISTNESWLVVIIAFAEVVITTILTVKIIRQTKNLNDKQDEFEEKNAKERAALDKQLNEQQLEMQRKQLRVDTFPYKREIYKNTFRIMEFCHNIKQYLDLPVEQFDAEKWYTLYKGTCEKFVPNEYEALWSMRESEYLLPPEIFFCVKDIRQSFDKIGAAFIAMPIVEKAINEVGGDAIENRRTMLKDIKEKCDNILKFTNEIEFSFPRELNLSGIDRS